MIHRCKNIEEELEELKEFANLEKDVVITALRKKVTELEETIDSINKQCVDLEQAANR